MTYFDKITPGSLTVRPENLQGNGKDSLPTSIFPELLLLNFPGVLFEAQPKLFGHPFKGPDIYNCGRAIFPYISGRLLEQNQILVCQSLRCSFRFDG